MFNPLFCRSGFSHGDVVSARVACLDNLVNIFEFCKIYIFSKMLQKALNGSLVYRSAVVISYRESVHYFHSWERC